MNMKSLIALTALTAAGAASAEVISDNTLCRIEINSGAKSTIVAVPLVKIGDGNAQIPVKDLVLTDNLAVGDKILHWNGSSWDAWVIIETAGVKSWSPTVISEGSKNSQTKPAENTALARGDAIWVDRASTISPFYIYGQIPTSSEGLTSVVTAGSSSQPGYTMMAAPATDSAGFKLNTLVSKKTAGDFADGDKIVIVDATARLGRREYTYKTETKNFSVEEDVLDSTNTYPIGVTWTAIGDDVVLPVGCGFWYVSVGGNPTITW